MTRILILGAPTAAIAATPASAGEITGNGKDLTIHGQSFCAYSGRNDTPNGLSIPIGGVMTEIDPGGDVQSYGYFKSQSDFFASPSDPAARAVRAFPGVGCNPNLGGSPTEG
jgi:hypothetical protein